MSGMVRGSARLLAALVVVALSLGGCQTDDEQSSDCEGFCERLEGLECNAESPGECSSDCATFEADLPEACRDSWRALLSCASNAEWICDPETCIPQDGPCGGSPELVGCVSEQEALQECFDDGGCTSEDGGGGVGLTDDGRTISYGYSSACGYCPMPLSEGGLEGYPCANAGDCAEVCCACPDRDMAAGVCLAGLCADACDPALDLCNL